MNKILLCGNGINIQFNKEFSFNKFIEILVNEKKLNRLIDEVLLKKEYQYFGKFRNDFLKIFYKCKNSILNLNEKAKLNGVEESIKIFKESVEILLLQVGENLKKESYMYFEKFFDLLFFYYLFQLEKNNRMNLLVNFNWNNKWRKYLNNTYSTIYTLNYDNLLEELFDSEFVKHVHGKLKIENNILSYDDCILESYQNPKYEISKKTKLEVFLNREKLKSKLSLDIIGINPINDENIFRFFILSQVCHEIIFYYFCANDLNNIIKIIKDIDYWNNDYEYMSLINLNESVKIKIVNTDPNILNKMELIENNSELIYIFNFLKKDNTKNEWENEHSVKIILRNSNKFWEQVFQLKTANIQVSIVDNKNEIIKE
ncbi:hypothetical protein [Spiroplasma attinicola]|uniref:hypothetical protein n=1 Tax=Spiroplasma attinicola TaxID=2904537 RepID=UPI002022A39F|nr:hypothetical protein [Spiroplasma sp. JKS002670]MCL8209630.1 hypothetical protein [Spiroplasma sp. JKS002670]